MKKLKLISLVMLGLTMVLSSHSLAMQNNTNPNNQNPAFDYQLINSKKQLDIYFENGFGDYKLMENGLIIPKKELKFSHIDLYLGSLKEILTLDPNELVGGKDNCYYKLIYYIRKLLRNRRDDRIIAQVRVPSGTMRDKWWMPQIQEILAKRILISDNSNIPIDPDNSRRISVDDFVGGENNPVYMLLQLIRRIIYTMKYDPYAEIGAEDFDEENKIPEDIDEGVIVSQIPILQNYDNDQKIRDITENIDENNVIQQLLIFESKNNDIKNNPYVPLTEQYNEGIYQDIHNNSFDSEIKINPNANQNNNIYNNLDYSMMNPIFRIFQNNYDDNQNNYDDNGN